MKCTSLTLTALLLAPLSVAEAACYYADSTTGNDSNSGGSPTEAWRSLEKINGITFQPGDRLLLKAGATWTGRLHPKGSGNVANRIVLDRYGEGPMPVIHGGGIAGGGVLLENQQHWSIRNLEVTNHGSQEPKKMGILMQSRLLGPSCFRFRNTPHRRPQWKRRSTRKGAMKKRQFSSCLKP